MKEKKRLNDNENKPFGHLQILNSLFPVICSDIYFLQRGVFEIKLNLDFLWRICVFHLCEFEENMLKQQCKAR